jgi:multidrug efflux pump subunit AcrA (membrane-fusion protein)
MSKYSLSAISLSVAGALLLAGCGGRNHQANAETRDSAPPPVELRITRAEMRNVPATIEVTGTLVADEASDVAPEIDGQVAATPVDIGAFVRKGALLVQLNPRDAELRLQQARAAEEQASAALRQAQARVGMLRDGEFDPEQVPEAMAARANYESAVAQAKLARADAARYRNLLKTGDVAPILFDQAETRAATMDAQAAAAKQQYEAALNTARQSAQAVEAAAASLNAARAQVGLAEKALGDTAVRAPFDGHITDRPVSVGEWVTKSAKVITVAKIQPIKANLQVPEAEAARVRLRYPVLATVQAHGSKTFEGVITAVNPGIDPASRSFTAEATFANKDTALRPGMFATAQIVQGEGRPVAFLPRSAVQVDPNTDSHRVWVIQNNTAHLRVIQIGRQDGDHVAVVSGVNESDAVATTGLDKLYEGAPVRVL